jgi:hypothetical protein
MKRVESQATPCEKEWNESEQLRCWRKPGEPEEDRR